MKKLKRYAISFALMFMIALCPVLMFACGKNGGGNENGKKIATSLNSAIVTMKNYSSTNSEVSTNALELVEVEDGLNGLVLLDYMKAVAGSANYDHPTLPFKSTMSVSDGTTNVDLYAIHKFSIEGNDISVEMVFTYENNFNNADYECMKINYDFETNTLISFRWYSYLASEGGSLYYYDYKFGVLKTLAEYESTEYLALKDDVGRSAQDLYNTQEIATKTYNFTKEYVAVYNDYNPEHPIKKA